MNRKVIIINDSKFECLVLSDLLKKINFNPIVCDEKNSVMKVIDENPSIAIVNYVMKELTGDKLAKKIKLVNPGIKCIMSSCNSLDQGEYEDDFIDAVIKTPIQAEKLVDIIIQLTA